MTFEIDKTHKLNETNPVLLNEQNETQSQTVSKNEKETAISSDENEFVELSIEEEKEDEFELDIENIRIDDTDIEDDKKDTSSLNQTNDKTDNDGVDLKGFKEFISKNEKIDELASKYGYDEVFKLFDKDNDGKITKSDIEKVNPTCETLEDFTPGEIKKFINNNISSADEDNSKITDENFDDIVEKLKQAFNTDNTQNQSVQAPVQTP